jgi:hypothetical protein
MPASCKKIENRLAASGHYFNMEGRVSAWRQRANNRAFPCAFMPVVVFFQQLADRIHESCASSSGRKQRVLSIGDAVLLIPN